MVRLGAIFMLYILLCCVNGSAQPDETARWLDQQSGIASSEKPHRFYGECQISLQLYEVCCNLCHIQVIIIVFVSASPLFESIIWSLLCICYVMWDIKLYFHVILLLFIFHCMAVVFCVSVMNDPC